MCNLFTILSSLYVMASGRTLALSSQDQGFETSSLVADAGTGGER